MATKKPRFNFDRSFFARQLLAQQMSQRQLAKRIELDASAVSLIFKGERELRLEEAQAIARVLKLKAYDVLRRAGVNIDLGDHKVMVKGVVSADGDVALRAGGTEYQTAISVPRDLDVGAFALLVRAPNDRLDKWLVLVAGHQQPARELHGRHALVAFSDGKQLIGYVESGYTENTVNLFRFITGHELMRESASAVWARAVVWLKAPNGHGG